MNFFTNEQPNKMQIYRMINEELNFIISFRFVSFLVFFFCICILWKINSYNIDKKLFVGGYILSVFSTPGYVAAIRLAIAFSIELLYKLAASSQTFKIIL